MSDTSITMRQGSARSHWRLIWAFAIRDLKGRFTATALGWIWTLIVPLATVFIYSLVFAVIFRAQAPPMGNGHEGVFAVWFFCGLVTWNLFAQTVNACIGSIVGMGPMMQKVYIPSYVPVFAAAITSLIERLLEAAVMLILMLVFFNVGWTWLLYPLVLVVTALFATCLGYSLAVSYVRFRDTGQIMAILLQMWFFVTPVIYPIDLIPEEVRGIPLRALIELNPMTALVQMSRDLIYGLTLPGPKTIAYVVGWTLLAAGAAAFIHRRWGQDLSEEI